MKNLIFLSFLFCSLFGLSQKKPLDHSVYDSWQSIGERSISNDGKWVVYSVNVQEGDNELVIQSPETNFKKIIPRGYNAVITEGNKFVVFRIRPTFAEIRDARIKKKTPEQMPKDSLGILQLGFDVVMKVANVKSYKTPQRAAGWVAYHKERPPFTTRTGSSSSTTRTVDSLKRTIDSLIQLLLQANSNRNNRDQDISQGIYAEGDEPSATDGTELVLRNLERGEDKIFKLVADYWFNREGQKLFIRTTRNSRDSLSKAVLVSYSVNSGRIDTLSRGLNDFRSMGIAENGQQVAFIAERDSTTRALQKFYKLWYYRTGMDSAQLLVDKNTTGMKVGMTVSENANVIFSKSGKRILFGTAPIQPARDTSLVEIDLVKLDLWHYNDDYLQSTQLSRLTAEQRLNYLAVYDLPNKILQQLGDPKLPQVMITNEGDGDRFIGVTDIGKRIESQWTANTLKDIYAIDVLSGKKKLVKENLYGNIFASSTGKYITWYDRKAKHYFAWDGDSTRNITKQIKMPLYDEEFDMPDEPTTYGLGRWYENDEALFVYSRYDLWKIDPSGKKSPINLTRGDGAKRKIVYRYVQTDPEERFVKNNVSLFLRAFNKTNKQSGYALLAPGGYPQHKGMENFSVGNPLKARESNVLVYTKENYRSSPDLYFARMDDFQNAGVAGAPMSPTAPSLSERKLSSLNPQQDKFNWGTAELFSWKTFSGKTNYGVLYKPEDFDPNKKYPVIFYFYDRHADDLFNYQPPSPTPSRLNVPFYVSRGYIVMSPDIYYKTGQPAKSAYDHIVSGAQALAKNKWVDAKNMGIQGQSWGGIQVVQLITMTPMFKAAWAGAPVANMTSAYGGIRWESGLNRQFQYERSQSRIGATLWEKPNLYIENSPLFHVPKIKTPLVIMANDADGAVPWYQGIELFTAMRRLGKQVWMLNYNGEAHNLVERKNRKDIQIRQQQYFDWLLKGEKPASWITEGIPAVKKGREWGL